MSTPNTQHQSNGNSPQIKICGLTRVDEALGCARLGADAIGFVFYPKSPRCVTTKQAAEIIRALPSHIQTVGVFVNESYSTIMRIVNDCRLNAVQLHGQESPELVRQLRRENLLVIKALFSGKEPAMTDVAKYDASAYLVECGKGVLPGGNARVWKWEEAKDFGNTHPFILAGGLSPENVEYAISVSGPDAVDVSSGVEAAPGRKDLDKVESFVKAVSRCTITKKMKRIFNDGCQGCKV